MHKTKQYFLKIIASTQWRNNETTYFYNLIAWITCFWFVQLRNGWHSASNVDLIAGNRLLNAKNLWFIYRFQELRGSHTLTSQKTLWIVCGFDVFF
jgi:hypothetical protein